MAGGDEGVGECYAQAAGEMVVVTDRGVPKALIVPVPGEGQLERGITEGWIRPAARTSGLAPIARVSSPARVLDVLGDDRDDRGE